MSDLFIPRHPAQPAKRSILTNLHNKVLGVKQHHGQAVRDKDVLTDKFTLGISQAMLEEARTTRAGRFLLELLGAVDYAGKQNRPVMLMGRKLTSGFKVTCVVPIDTRMKPGAPPTVSTNGQGVERVG